ncbi:hypothetical protein BGZ57DRAFT_856308 [Hyaloscypha finlandica]|nr:hypothetical protein BGZ57DRAFT_856308 [Hyaloscypha finlandica]
MRNFSEVIPGQEFLETLTGILLVTGVGFALIWLGGRIVRTPQQVLRNHVPTPNFALELDSILPKVQDYSQPPQLDSYIAVFGFPVIKSWRAGYTKWTTYNLSATQDDIKCRCLDDGMVDIDEKMRKMDPMARDELQRLLESKRLAGHEGRSPYSMFKVAMLKPVSSHDVASNSIRKQVGWSFRRAPLASGIEYVVLIRGTTTRRHTPSKEPRNLDFAAGWSGWQMMGSRPRDYQRDIDHVSQDEINVSFASIDGKACDAGFGAMAQVVDASNYRCKRVRMAALVKSEDVKQWAGLWVRVDGPDYEVQSFDNMEDRPIQGSNDWTRYEIVLPVFEDSWEIFFGIILDGTGKLWLRDVQINVAE